MLNPDPFDSLVCPIDRRSEDPENLTVTLLGVGRKCAWQVYFETEAMLDMVAGCNSVRDRGAG